MFCMIRVIRSLLFFGVNPIKYKSLRKYNSRRAVKRLVEKRGADTINRGYQVKVYRHPVDRLEFYPGRHMIIENAEYVSGIFGVGFSSSSGLWDDFDSCRMAEEDGIPLINDIPGLEKGRYVDTPKNRKICAECLEVEPRYRIENWLRTYTPFGRMYTDIYGDPTGCHKYAAALGK